MRFVAPARDAIDPVVFTRPPLSQWLEFRELLCGPDWAAVDSLNAYCKRLEQGQAHAQFGANSGTRMHAPRFVAQSPALLADGLHYEQRIAERGEIATRERNWHDLLNALIWMRYPQLKSALNGRQVAEIAVAGPKTRTRAQCALTHFDEAGIVVLVRDEALASAWDAHDWHGLFWREREAWLDGRIDVSVFGHALLEHALKPHQLLVGKALAIVVPRNAERETRDRDICSAIGELASAIRRGELLNDPQELRPLPLSGIPGWRAENDDEDFYRSAPCFRPRRAERRYPAPFSPSSGSS
jgi:hypothetical protein